MKKLLIVLAGLLVLTACSSGNKDKETLKFFNWGEYINPEVIQAFEEEYNVIVNQSYFESNEAMYTKLQDGSRFDVVIPSDYTVQRMREDDMLMELDYSKIPNYKNINEFLLGKPMDPENKYTVPYFWGNVGILYNKNAVSKAQLEKEGWDILINPEYKGRLYFYDSERDAFMVALKALGYSMNSSDASELSQAYDWLVKQRQTMDPIYVTDEVLDGMIAGNKDLAVVYSGDATYIIQQNPDMAYFEPLQGTNTWVDMMVIPKNAENPDLAHKFMNFILEKEMGILNTEEVGYTSPLPEVVDFVTSEGGAFYGVESYITRTDFEKDEVFTFNKDVKVILSDYWLRVRAAK